MNKTAHTIYGYMSLSRDYKKRELYDRRWNAAVEWLAPQATEAIIIYPHKDANIPRAIILTPIELNNPQKIYSHGVKIWANTMYEAYKLARQLLLQARKQHEEKTGGK